jgi:hypothetical protein
MKTQRRSATTGGEFTPESVTSFIGIRNITSISRSFLLIIGQLCLFYEDK